MTMGRRTHQGTTNRRARIMMARKAETPALGAITHVEEGLVLAEAADTRTPTTRQEFLRGLEKLSTPGDMSNVKSSIIASLISSSHATPSTAPSSPGTDSSGSSDYISSSDISLDSNDRTLVHDHPSADPHIKVHKSHPLDTDLDDIDSESGELTLAAYRDRLAMLGVRVKLVTREQMDVLLARG
ncbi:hypothetical protein C356_04216 [Cryptococcus neoformans c45]|nr:hypothetical protein C356_04216 [Cryptococcus neoformans var. grubii c45]